MAGEAEGQKKAVRPASRHPHGEEYILWKEREGRVPKGAGEEVEQEEEETWGKRMKEAEEQRAIIREHLGQPLRTEKREEIINMSIEDTLIEISIEN